MTNKVRSAVCKEFGITEEELLKRTNQPKVVLPRQVCFYVYRSLTGASYRNCNIELNLHYDHSTVHYGIERVKGFLEVYPEFKEKVERIVKQVA